MRPLMHRHSGAPLEFIYTPNYPQSSDWRVEINVFTALFVIKKSDALYLSEYPRFPVRPYSEWGPLEDLHVFNQTVNSGISFKVNDPRCRLPVKYWSMEHRCGYCLTVVNGCCLHQWQFSVVNKCRVCNEYLLKSNESCLFVIYTPFIC